MRVADFHGTIKVFGSTVLNPNKRKALEAMGQSGKALGLACSIVEDVSYSPCDVAVVWGLPKQEEEVGEGFSQVHVLRNEIFAQHQGPVVILEAPLLGRRVVPKRRRSWFMRKFFPLNAPWTDLLLPRSMRGTEFYEEFRIGIGGGLSDDGGLALAPHCVDRWEEVSRRLGISDIRPYRKDGRHVLLIGQVPGDASLRGEDINGWISRTCRQIRHITDRPIIVRLHPLAYAKTASTVMKIDVADVSLEEPAKPLAQSLQNAWVTVSYSSGAAIESLLAGVPAIAVSSASFAWEVTDHDLSAINNPTEFDRRSWLDRLCAAQWSMPELKAGHVWQPLTRACSEMMYRRIAAE